MTGGFEGPDSWPSRYLFWPELHAEFEGFSIRPIAWHDRNAVRQWRNEQLDVLRQRCSLSVSDQNDYFLRVVRPQFEMKQPPQLLFGYLNGSDLAGYGGLVHIDWENLRAEVSFLAATERVHAGFLPRDLARFLTMLTPLARQVLGLHKLTTEAFASRAETMKALEEFGFAREGHLKGHYWDGERWSDSVIHGLLL